MLTYSAVEPSNIKCNDKLRVSEDNKYRFANIYYKDKKSERSDRSDKIVLAFKTPMVLIEIKQNRLNIFINSGEKGKTFYTLIRGIDDNVKEIAKDKVENKKWWGDNDDIDVDCLDEMFKDSIRANESGRVLTVGLHNNIKIVDPNGNNFEDNLDRFKDKPVKATIVLQLNCVKFKKTSFQCEYVAKVIKLNDVVKLQDAEDSDYDVLENDVDPNDVNCSDDDEQC